MPYFVQTDIIIIDEATQLHKNYLEDLDDKLRDLKGNRNPFGGINDFSRRLQANTTYSYKISSASSNQGVYKEHCGTYLKMLEINYLSLKM